MNISLQKKQQTVKKKNHTDANAETHEKTKFLGYFDTHKTKRHHIHPFVAALAFF